MDDRSVSVGARHSLSRTTLRHGSAAVVDSRVGEDFRMETNATMSSSAATALI